MCYDICHLVMDVTLTDISHEELKNIYPEEKVSLVIITELAFINTKLFIQFFSIKEALTIISTKVTLFNKFLDE